MLLQFNEGRQVTVRADAGTIQLTRGFSIHRLTLPLELRPSGIEYSRVPFHLRAQLHTSGADTRWLSTAEPHLTHLYRSDQTTYLNFPLTNDQLFAVEEHRAGGPLALELKVHGYLQTWEETVEASTHVRVPASTWHEEIERLGAAVALTLSIPLPADHGAQREAAEYLRDARQLLNAGRYDKAIGSARQAMERAEAVAQWPGITKADDLRQRSQAQRWRAIYRAAFDQASGAEHADEVTKDFSYSRVEAEALIGIAAALLKAAPAPLH